MTAPVWPQVPREKGHYESFYLRAADPASPRAVWIRHTVHKRPGHEPLGSLWFTLFEDGAVTARKHTEPAPRAGEWIDIGSAHFGPDGARGAFEDVGWDLAITPLAEHLSHLPAGFMYRAPLPRTKPESPIPHAEFNGRAGSLDVSGWRGMCGHNWGTEHAETWIWMQGALFEEDPTAWLDLTVARVRIGPLLTPWIANGAYEIGGLRRRIRGVAKVSADARRADIRIGALRLDVRSRDIVVWRYAGPDLRERHSAHSSNAAVTMTADGRTLHSPHGSAYELGREPGGHTGLEVQPYPDGV